MQKTEGVMALVVKAPLLLLVVLVLIGAALPSFNQQWSVARALLGEYQSRETLNIASNEI